MSLTCTLACVEVPLPSGDLKGDITFVEGKNEPIVNAVKPDSPLGDVIVPGYIARELKLGDGTIISSILDSVTLEKVLNESYNDPYRRLKFEMGYPNEMIFTIPKKTYNDDDIKIEGKLLPDGTTKPTVIHINHSNPKLRNLRCGMCIHSIELKGWYRITGGTVDDIYEALTDNKKKDCIIVLKHPDIAIPPKRIQLDIE